MERELTTVFILLSIKKFHMLELCFNRWYSFRHNINFHFNIFYLVKLYLRIIDARSATI